LNRSLFLLRRASSRVGTEPPANLRKRIGFAIDALKGKIVCLPPDRVGRIQYHQE
jgi:hypothetical protein